MWHRPPCDRQERDAGSRLHPGRDRHRSRDRRGDGRVGRWHRARVTLACRIGGRERVRPIPGQRANDRTKPGRRGPCLYPGRVRRRYGSASALGRPERRAGRHIAAGTARPRNDRRNGVARKSAVRVRGARERIAQRTTGLPRRRQHEKRRGVPTERRVPFRDQSGGRQRGPLRTVPHDACEHRRGDVDCMAMGNNGAAPNTVRRSGLHGNIASKRADVDGELPANVHTNRGRLRAGFAARCRRTLSRDDHRSARDDRCRRDWLADSTSNADERKRSPTRHTNINPSGSPNHGRNLHRESIRMATIGLGVHGRRHSRGQLYDHGSGRRNGRSRRNVRYGNGDDSIDRYPGRNPDTDTSKMRPSHKRKVLSPHRGSNVAVLLQICTSR